MDKEEFDLPRAPLLSIEQQWRMVARWREALILSAEALAPSAEPAHLSVDEAEIGVPLQALADLEHAWQRISKSNYWPIYWPLFRDSPERIAATPVEALFSYVQSGLYPPPELLLAVRGAFESYVDAKGDVVLEEAFFGPPKRKAGNYAARRRAAFEEFKWVMRIMSRARDGKTDTQVAEEIIKDEGLNIDPESLLRRARKHWKRDPKQEK